MKKLVLGLMLATAMVAIAMPLKSEESLVGTAWQCGRHYIQITFFGLGGAAQEGLIWPNKKGPYGDGEELMLHQLGHPPPDPFLWRNCPKNCQLTYHDKKRYKPCVKVKPPKESTIKTVPIPSGPITQPPSSGIIIYPPGTPQPPGFGTGFNE
jgi:hypothetical protein